MEGRGSSSWRNGRHPENQDGRMPGRQNQAGSGPAPGSDSIRPPVLHERHLPRETRLFHIPRKENRALFQNVSVESREFEDILSILTCNYKESASDGCYTYSKPRLVHSEVQEKEFVEKRKELKADGRTDLELEESHCFLLVDNGKLQSICEKGLFVGHSWINALGKPDKGVYLSKYSDLLQINAFNPGATGEIIIFKVMKGKVKSVYENMSKRFLDPTPKFDSHVFKNASSKIKSLTSYRAYELSQIYFYEYSFDELRSRPRQVCPYAVVSFQFKGKDTPLPSKPLAPIRLNSQLADGSQGRVQYTVWSGDLVKGGKLVSQVSLQSFPPPFLPVKLSDKLEAGCLMSLHQVTEILPSSIFSWNLYAGSHEVVKNGQYCTLLEVTDRSRTENKLSKLLQELEDRNLLLVNPLIDCGYLFLLSSAQLALPTERGDRWKHCLQALFVFPEHRDVAKHTFRCDSSSHDASTSSRLVMPRLQRFLPALHQALVKVRANPPPELSAGVEQHARDYLSGQKECKVREYPLEEYDGKLDHRDKLFSAPKHHKLNMDNYLRSYLYTPSNYRLTVARASAMVEQLCGPEEVDLMEEAPRRDKRGHVGAEIQFRPQQSPTTRELHEKDQGGGMMKRKREEEVAERRLKFQRKEEDRPTSLHHSARGASHEKSQFEVEGAGLGESVFDRLDSLASKLGLPIKCDIDLRKQEELEEQTAGSVSSLEGFSPGSHSGDTSTSRGASRRGGEAHWSREKGEEEIPWVLIPITGLEPRKDRERDGDLLLDPRFLPVAMTTTTPKGSPTPSPVPSLSPSPFPSPEPIELSPANEYPSPVNEERLSPIETWDSIGISGEDTEEGIFLMEERVEEPSIPVENSLSLLTEDRAIKMKGDEEEEEVVVGHVTVQAEEVTTQEKQRESLVEPGVQEVEGEEIEKEQEEGQKLTELNHSCLPASSPSPGTHMNSIVEKHLADFSSRIQSILQREQVHYNQPSQHALHTQTLQHTHPAAHTHLPPFSFYVSFSNSSLRSNSCPSVESHVASLRQRITTALNESQDNWPDANAMLARNVSAFVSGIRSASSARSASPSLAPSYQPGPSAPHPALLPLPPMPCPPCPPSVDSQSQLHPQNPHCPLPGSSAGQGSTLNANVSSSNGSKHPVMVCGPDGSRQVTIPGLGDPCPASESSDSSEPTARPQQNDSSSCPASLPTAGLSQDVAPAALRPSAPPPVISSLISQLQPEVLSSLENIIRDVRKNSVQFYIHSPEEDQVYDQIKDYLLRQGNVEQSPVAFLDSESSSDRLMVIIQNKHIAEHIHKIPSLVSLKRHPQVGFLGVDSLDDLRNNSSIELFLSGGFIVSDEFVLSPAFITHERLAALLMFLEQLNSPESVWRWRVHCKTQKKLKQQARFKRDAATLLDLLSAYQKRLIVEFLPYHHCDTSNGQSPDLDCLIELQARYTQHRHIIFLTERRFEMFPNYSSSGIVVANLDDITHNFSSLVGYHDIRDRQPILPDPKGVGCRKPSHEDSTLSSELSSSLPYQASQHLLPHPDQLVPSPPPTSSSTSSNEGATSSDPDFVALRLAISHLRAERQARSQQLDPQTEFEVKPLQSFFPSNHAPVGASDRQIQLTSPSPQTHQEVQRQHMSHSAGHMTPPSSLPAPGKKKQLTPARKAVADTLASIHSALETDGGEEEVEREKMAKLNEELGKDTSRGVAAKELLSEGGTRRERGGKLGTVKEPAEILRRDGEKTPSDAMPANQSPHLASKETTNSRAAPANHSAAPQGLTTEKAERAGASSMPCTTTSSLIDSGLTRQRDQGQMSAGNQDASSKGSPEVRSYMTMFNSIAPPQHVGSLFPQPGASGDRLYRAPTFHHNPMLGPLSAFGRMQGLLGPGAMWPGASPEQARAAFFWSLQHAVREFSPGLMGNHPNSGSQGGNRLRRGHRGGFGGM